MLQIFTQHLRREVFFLTAVANHFLKKIDEALGDLLGSFSEVFSTLLEIVPNIVTRTGKKLNSKGDVLYYGFICHILKYSVNYLVCYIYLRSLGN